MEYRRLGKSGVKVSALSLGSWPTFGHQIGDDVARDLMKTAYDNGVNFFDNAEGYADGRAETVMGNIFREMAWPRETYLAGSKVFYGGNLTNQQGLSRKRVVEGCHGSLRRLRVDYLDFLWCHKFDSVTPLIETVQAMNDLVRQGKVLYWGTSNWKPRHIRRAHALCRKHHLIPPTMEQSEYNILARRRVERDYAWLYYWYGMGNSTYHALAYGLLSGKHQDGLVEGTRATLPNHDWMKNRITSDLREKGEKLRKLGELANEVGLSLAVFSIAWCLKNPHVNTVILGVSKVAQLTENLQAIDAQAKLTPDVMKRVHAIAGI